MKDKTELTLEQKGEGVLASQREKSPLASQIPFPFSEISIEEIINYLPFFNREIREGMINNIKQRINNPKLSYFLRFKYAEIIIKILEQERKPYK